MRYWMCYLVSRTRIQSQKIKYPLDILNVVNLCSQALILLLHIEVIVVGIPNTTS